MEFVKSNNWVEKSNKFIKPPLSYQGGKGRIASKIIDVIDNDCNIDNKEFFHDFCSGSGAVSIELFNRFPNIKVIMYDISPMGVFYKMVKNNNFDLESFKKEIDKIPKDPYLVKAHLESLNKSEFDIYKFLILQAGSFGGKQVNYKK